MCLAHINVSCMGSADNFNTNNKEDNRCQFHGTKPFEWSLSRYELQPQIQCVDLCSASSPQEGILTDMLVTEVLGPLVWISHLCVL